MPEIDLDLGAPYQCPSCHGPVKTLEADGYCRSCTMGAERAVDEDRQRESIRQLNLSCALLLERLGFPERAAIHRTMGEER